jgi:hypothetical protein
MITVNSVYSLVEAKSATAFLPILLSAAAWQMAIITPELAITTDLPAVALVPSSLPYTTSKQTP